MWILIAIGVGIVALAHTAPAPFLMDALAGRRSVWQHAEGRSADDLFHVR
jgi:hypothetical protein